MMLLRILLLERRRLPLGEGDRGRERPVIVLVLVLVVAVVGVDPGPTEALERRVLAVVVVLEVGSIMATDSACLGEGDLERRRQ